LEAREVNILITEISFDDITLAEIEQYENDPDVEVEVDGDKGTVFVIKKQY
jgi:hypothetical protein